MDKTTTTYGTCGWCEHRQAVGSDHRPVLHGYRRPGDGYAHDNCEGMRYLAWELSNEAAVAAEEILVRYS